MMSRPSILITRDQHDLCCNAIRHALGRTLKAKEPLTATQWCDENFYLSPESSGQEGHWTTLPYQVAILDLMGADEPRIVDLRKSARIGYTKMLVGATAYRLEHKRRNVAHYQPTDGDAQEFCKAEIDPMIRDVPLLADLSDEQDNKKRDDTLSLKKLGRRLFYIRGGNSPARYRRVTVDYVDYDELDGFEREIGTEGDPLSLGDRAITNSSFPRSFRGSTPSNKHDSLIEQEVQNASLFFEYHVMCPECGHMQALSFGQFKWLPAEEDRTKEERAESVRYQCADCELPIYYREILDLLASGKWRTEDGHEIQTGDHEPLLLDPDGLVLDWPRHVALYIWAAYSTFFSWQEMIQEWLEAQGHVLKLKTFTNHRLGQVFGDDVEDIDENALFARREAYGVPNEILVVLASIDIQETWAEISIAGYDPNERSWFLAHKPFYGSTDKYPAPIYTDMADYLATAEFVRNDGVVLKVSAIIVDTGHNTAQAYMFASKLRHKRVYATKGVGGDRAVVTLPPSTQTTLDGREILLYSAGVDNAKRVVMNRLRSDSPSRIELNLDVTQEHCEQLTAEKLTTQYKRGFAKKVWVKTRERNELLDLYVYQLVALYILRPNWIRLAAKLNPETQKARKKKTAKARQTREEAQRQRRKEGRSARSKRNPVTKW